MEGAKKKVLSISSKIDDKQNYSDSTAMVSLNKQEHSEGNNNDSNNEKKSVSEKSTKYSLHQKLALVSLALVDFMCFCSMSIMAPFFPREAGIKGMSDMVSGFVFSFYALVMFLSSPIFGKILPRVGEKPLFIIGIFSCGICNILFGTLEYINNYTLFTFLSFFIRGLEALGASAYSTASYVFVINIFPEHIGAVRGTLEIFVGLGMSAGPAIGGFLFSFGGFGLPFYVVGFICLIVTPMNFYLLPSSKNEEKDRKTGSILELIRIPGVIVNGFVIITLSITWSFLDPTLEPHLRQYNLSPEKVGLLFLLLSALYGLSSPGWGWLSDKNDNHWSMMAIGLFFSSLGLLLLGPSPFFPFLNGSLWTIIPALSIIGLAIALALLPTFDGLLKEALKGGLEDNLATQSIVAGMWSCYYSLGEVIGPSIGGLLLQFYGFPVSATTVAVVNLIIMVVCIVYFSADNVKMKLKPCVALDFENSVEGSWRTCVVTTESELKPKEKY